METVISRRPRRTRETKWVTGFYTEHTDIGVNGISSSSSLKKKYCSRFTRKRAETAYLQQVTLLILTKVDKYAHMWAIYISPTSERQVLLTRLTSSFAGWGGSLLSFHIFPLLVNEKTVESIVAAGWVTSSLTRIESFQIEVTYSESEKKESVAGTPRLTYTCN